MHGPNFNRIIDTLNCAQLLHYNAYRRTVARQSSLETDTPSVYGVSRRYEPETRHYAHQVRSSAAKYRL